MKHLFSILFASSSLMASSQILIGGDIPNDFVATTLSSHNTSISNVTYTGSDGAVAYFSANVQNMPFTSGLLMTTGGNTSAIGPNVSGQTSVVNYQPGYPYLQSILGVETFDAAIISFDVIPSGNSLKIRYIFASEEYPEYVGSQYYDGMAIFISGPGISGFQNIARLPNGDPITINKVNNGNSNPASGVAPSGPVNPAYYVSNGNGTQPPYNSSNTYLQFDGLTVPLTAQAAVVPGETYHITIAIADGGDRNYDSGVFIEAGGITASLGENNLDQFISVFYNDVNQQATIEVTEFQDQLTYSISDLSGKVLAASKITETTVVDMNDYASGIYLINVKGPNGQISKKVLR